NRSYRSRPGIGQGRAGNGSGWTAGDDGGSSRGRAGRESGILIHKVTQRIADSGRRRNVTAPAKTEDRLVVNSISAAEAWEKVGELAAPGAAVAGRGKNPRAIERLRFILRRQQRGYGRRNRRRRGDHFRNGLAQIQPLGNAVPSINGTRLVLPTQTEIQGQILIDLPIIHKVRGVTERHCFLDGHAGRDRTVIDEAQHKGGPLAARRVQVRARIGVGRECLFDIEGNRLEPGALAAIDAIFAAELKRVRTRINIHAPGEAVALRVLPKLASRTADATRAYVKRGIVILRERVERCVEIRREQIGDPALS